MARWLRSHLRVFVLSAAGIAALLMAVALGVGWYFAGEIYSGAFVVSHDADTFDLEIAAVGDGTIDLRAGASREPDEQWLEDSITGLRWDGGYAQLGRVVQRGDAWVRRDFLPMQGGIPAPGTPAGIDSFAYPSDPFTGLGLAYEDVAYTSEQGAMPAWLVRGSTSRWVIFVHGKEAPRREALRMLTSVVGSGANALVIAYRNDEDAPSAPDDRHRWGASEWRDLEAAAAYAVANGASDLVIVGYSMGGAVTLGFMANSALADRVTGIILDAPALSLAGMVDMEARDRGLPGALSWWGRQFASWRYGIDWEAIDWREEARALTVPVLLFHGSGDAFTEFAESQAWANDRPQNVRFVPLEGVGHVRAWNANPDAYHQHVAEFLATLPAN